METYIVVLYVLLAASILAPAYTYAIYPVLLNLFPAKHYKENDDYKPFVSVLVTASNYDRGTPEKAESLTKLKYPSEKIEYLVCSAGTDNITDFITLDVPPKNKADALAVMKKAAKGDVLVITDSKTPLDENAISSLVGYFADKRVGCVVGQSRSDLPSAFWKYENLVRAQEGKIGCVSGANKALYAVRSGIIDNIPSKIINEDFYISTLIKQNGFDVLFDSEAIAYEISGQTADHVRDGAGSYQALAIFWRMLIPGKGSFVYISHRVMKWFVPINLTTALICSVILSFYSVFAAILCVLQVLLYVSMLIYHFVVVKKGRQLNGLLGKLLSLAYYFVSLNCSLFKGLMLIAANKY